jgi:hypothetical protein
MSPTLSADRLTAVTHADGTWGPIQDRDEDLAVASYRIRPDLSSCNDTMTGDVLTMALTAPAHSEHRVVTINLLTTLVVNLMQRGLSEEAADQQVKDLLSLESASSSRGRGRRLAAAATLLPALKDFDPMAVLNDSRSGAAAKDAAVRVLARNAQVFVPPTHRPPSVQICADAVNCENFGQMCLPSLLRPTVWPGRCTRSSRRRRRC